MNVQIPQVRVTDTNLKQNGDYRPYIIADDREREVIAGVKTAVTAPTIKINKND